jgi:ribosomal protein S1
MRIQPYGAFVELAAGIEGLLHVSAFGRRVATPDDVVSVGDKTLVRIKEIDPELRRIALVYVDPEQLDNVIDSDRKVVPNALNADVVGYARVVEPTASESNDEAKPAPRSSGRLRPAKIDALLDVVVDRHARFGLFVSWQAQNGVSAGEGLIPLGELEVRHAGELHRKLPIGTTLEALVVDVRADGKVRLSQARAKTAKLQVEARSWMAAQDDQEAPSGGDDSIGSLGELLKEKLGL